MSEEDLAEYVIDPTTTDTKYMANEKEFVDQIDENFETLAIDHDDWETIRLLTRPDVSHFSPTGEYDDDVTRVFVNVYLKDGTMINAVRSNRDGFHGHRITLRREMFRNPQNPKIYKLLNSVPPLKKTAAEALLRSRQVPESGTPERDIYDRARTAGRRRKVKRRRTKRKLRIPKRKGK